MDGPPLTFVSGRLAIERRTQYPICMQYMTTTYIAIIEGEGVIDVGYISAILPAQSMTVIIRGDELEACKLTDRGSNEK